jgi:hypothetical protein
VTSWHHAVSVALACSLVLPIMVACGEPMSSASTDETSESSTSATATTEPEQTATNTSDTTAPETESDTGTATDTDSESDEPESESETTAGEPDLPPEADCVPWAEALEFDDLCFQPPLTIDPVPMHAVERVLSGEGPNVYAAGPDDHRFYTFDQLQPGDNYHSLGLAGTTVHAGQVSLVGDWVGSGLFMIVTRDPHALVLVQVGSMVETKIQTYIELDAEPTAATRFRDPEKMENKIALTDVEANLHVFELEMGITTLTSTRVLPELLESLQSNQGWIGVSGTQLLGRSNATLTAWFLSPPIAGGGTIDAYAYPVPISAWDIGLVSDNGPPHMITFTQEPSVARYHTALDFQERGYAIPLAHPVNALAGGKVPSGAGATFVLSTADARLGHLMSSNGEGIELQNPPTWIDVAPNCVDFVGLAELGFLCASTSEGLVLISPD